MWVGGGGGVEVEVRGREGGVGLHMYAVSSD